MRITYLGQAGFLLETQALTILIDPYLSDSVERINPKNYRRVPVDPRFFRIRPDVMLFTHNHPDHYDPDTVSRFLSAGGSCTVLAPRSVWQEVRHFGGDHNYVLFNRHTQWTQAGIRFTAVLAEHSDPSPIGVIVDDGSRKYYFTGDTLYNEQIFADIPDDIYALFLPVNGVGNNMNMDDASRFAQRIRPQKVVPMHIGLFDSLSADAFACDNKVIPAIYQEVVL